MFVCFVLNLVARATKESREVERKSVSRCDVWSNESVAFVSSKELELKCFVLEGESSPLVKGLQLLSAL